MRDLTLCLPYYINAGMLAEQYRHLDGLPDELKTHLRLIVVDDASPTDPATPPASPIGLPVQIYRFRQDIAWNQDAARNLAVARASTDWVVLTDIDHLVAQTTLQRLIDGKLRADTAYKFALRLDAPGLTPKLKAGKHHPHPNSYAITRALYDQVGGYDEALAGNYGTDGDFARRLAAEAKIEWLQWPLIRYPREVIADASTTTLERKNPADKQRMREIMLGRGPGWRPMRNRWAWDQVA